VDTHPTKIFRWFLDLFNRKPLPHDPEAEPENELEVDLDPITIVRPNIQFRILQAFQKHQLYFVDMDSGKYLDGLLHLPSIGLTFTPPPKKVWQPSLGFLSLGPMATPFVEPDPPNLVEIDAILFFEYDGPECKTGCINEIEGEKIYRVYLTIWNDYELCQWNEIVESVIADLTLTKNGLTFPLVKFIITSSFVPNKPTVPNRLVIEFKKSDDCQEGESAISDQSIVPEEDDYEDSHKFKPRF